MEVENLAGIYKEIACTMDINTAIDIQFIQLVPTSGFIHKNEKAADRYPSFKADKDSRKDYPFSKIYNIQTLQ